MQDERQEHLFLDLQKHMAVKFLEHLEIEVLGSGRIWRPGSSAALTDVKRQQRSANVVAASVVAFADGLYGQQKEDLLNSTLLAQLAANKKYDRARDTLNWYVIYLNVLEKLGWSLEKQRSNGGPLVPERPIAHRGDVAGLPLSPGRVSQFRFDQVVVDRPRFTTDMTVLPLLRKRVNEDAFNTIQAALEALKGLDDRDRRVVIFESSSHNAGRGNFQIVVVSGGPGEELRMTIAAVFFITTERVSRVLSFHFAGSSTQMFQARDTLTLNATVYDAIRDQVLQQLGDQASAYIDELMSA
jgi:hypothetical protein